MNRILIVGILLISTAPLYAQNVAKLKEDARNAVGIIGADRGKTQTYCEIVDLLGRQLGWAYQEKHKKRADREKDKKKTKASLQRIDHCRKNSDPNSSRWRISLMMST